MIAIIILSGLVSGATGPGDLAERIARETRGWSSIELEVQTTQSVYDQGADPRAGLQIDETYIETSRGRRFREIRSRDPNGDSVRRVGTCDGSRCAEVLFREDQPDAQDQVVISRDFLNEAGIGFVQRPDPLRYHYVGLIPLHEAIAKAEPMGEGRVLDRPCDRFLFTVPSPRGPTQVLVYHLDRQSGIPLKVSAYRDRADADTDSPSWTWEAMSFDEIEGRHLPRSSRLETFQVVMENGTAVRRPDIRNRIVVQAAHFDRAYPGATFQTTPQPGVQVFDVTRQKAHRVPGGDPITAEATSLAPVGVENAIRATEPVDWVRVVALALLVLGAVSLLAVGVIRLRRGSTAPRMNDR